MQRIPTEKIHEEMEKVTASGEGLTTVAWAVSSLNLSLAHHAAWTEERFDNVDRRFDQVDSRLGGLETGHLLILGAIGQMSAAVGKMSSAIGTMSSEMGGMRSEIGGVKSEMGAMRSDMGAMAAKIDRIEVRIDQVLSFAVRDELKVDEIAE
ncbi:MAG TPA: hypothetical protein DGG94_03940 [Micromonosporaceae bacterium]|nr:hypothetical protein [Micromonosporaceae bacterium]HCU48951.1 hypothetical protein [Micromonosporaceae bacterium]